MKLFPLLSVVFAEDGSFRRTRENSRLVRPAVKPNVIIMLADDLGIGDVGVYNSESKIPTPNIGNGWIFFTFKLNNSNLWLYEFLLVKIL